MYNVILSESAKNVYENLRSQDFKKVRKGLCLIEQSPFYYPGKIIPLKRPLSGKYRCKEGKWRIIYSINKNQNEINIEAICTRSKTPY